MKNIFKTFLLLLAMTLILVFIGDYLGGRQGMLIALGVAVLLNFGSYWFSDKIVLAMYRARDPQPGSQSERRAEVIVRNLTTQANLPLPRVKVIDTEVPNAFATGRNPQHAVVAVTTGILGILNDNELAAVLAHELTHVKNRDILIGAIAATLAGAITMIARMAYWIGGDRNRGAIGALLMLLLAPLAALLIQLAVSRSREYAADRGAGVLTNRPLDLIQALEKLHLSIKQRPLAVTGGSQTTAHLFIVNPFKFSNIASLFSTHPTLEQRRERLQTLDQELRGVVKGA
jgi:heat shock protein HtpX